MLVDVGLFLKMTVKMMVTDLSKAASINPKPDFKKNEKKTHDPMIQKNWNKNLTLR